MSQEKLFLKTNPSLLACKQLVSQIHAFYLRVRVHYRAAARGKTQKKRRKKKNKIEKRAWRQGRQSLLQVLVNSEATRGKTKTKKTRQRGHAKSTEHCDNDVESKAVLHHHGFEGKRVAHASTSCEGKEKENNSGSKKTILRFLA